MTVNLPEYPKLRERYLAADLQLAVEAFKKTTVSHYLLLRAAMDPTDALAALADVKRLMTDTVCVARTSGKRH